MLPNFLAKRKLRRQLSKYVSADAVEAMVHGRPLDRPKIQSGRIEFIFVLVRAESPEQLSERIRFVADAGVKHDAVFMTSLVRWSSWLSAHSERLGTRPRHARAS